MNNKKKLTALVLGIFALIVVTTGVSFAFFTYSRTSETKTTITTGDLAFSYFENKDNVTITNQYPLSDLIGAVDENNVYNFQVGYDSTNTSKMYYDVIFVTNNTGENNFTNDQIKYNLVKDNVYIKGDEETGIKLSEINGLTANTSTGEGVALSSQEINNGEVHNYKLRLWISDDVSYNDEITNGKMIGKYNSYTYSLKVKINASQETTEQDTNLYTIIKNSSLGNEASLINYNQNSNQSGTNGVYTTTKTEGNVPVYFYRGNVENNVIFNNMCWKIIRTTETGGIKLIYNGLPTEQDGKQVCVSTNVDISIGNTQFNTSYDDNAYVGYMYGTPGSSTYEETHANINDSTIKTYIDNWFSNNFDQNTINKLEDTVFCNDRSVVDGKTNNILDEYMTQTIKQINSDASITFETFGYGNKSTGYGAISRSTNYTIDLNPTYVCPQSNDKFTLKSDKSNYNADLNGNKALDYPVGLITVDEAIFAGFNRARSPDLNMDNANKNCFLYKEFPYWTMSPNLFVGIGPIGIGNVSTVYKGSVAPLQVDCVEPSSGEYAVSILPVVSLKNGVQVNDDGDGTILNPYVIK